MNEHHCSACGLPLLGERWSVKCVCINKVREVRLTAKFSKVVRFRSEDEAKRAFAYAKPRIRDVIGDMSADLISVLGTSIKVACDDFDLHREVTVYLNGLRDGILLSERVV